MELAPGAEFGQTQPSEGLVIQWETRETGQGLLTPQLQHGSLDGLAGVDIDNLNVEMEWNADLIVDDLAPDRLSGDICSS